MRIRSVWAPVLGILSAAAVHFAPAQAQRASLAMLDHFESGNWQLRMRGGSGDVETICLDSGRKLIQLKHPTDSCSSVIVDDTQTEVTVHYTCPGRGYGQTHIRRESSRLAQIDSQGIADSLPFNFEAEARRVGECQD